MKLNLENINAVIFDLGGVLINLDYSLTEKAFRDLGARDFEALFSQSKQSALFDEFDKGHLSVENFRQELKKHLPTSISDTDVDTAWNAMLLELPEDRLTLLKNLQKKYKTFLLSNTNKIHIREINSRLQKAYNINTLHPFFEKVFYSYEIGMRKPDLEVFDYVLQYGNLRAEETLFIDDSSQHIEGAKTLGIQTYLLGKREDIISLF